MFNARNVRLSSPERFESVPSYIDQPSTLSQPPSSGMPFYQVDMGQAGPRFIRSSNLCAPATQKL